MWEPYSLRKKFLPDFMIEYQLFKTEDGGRKNPPFQGYRCDFSYEGDDIQKDGIFMIHPEFLNENRSEILDDTKPIPMTGLAYMWILIPEMRTKIHVNRLKVGTKGFFMEGPKKVGSVKVVEILGLFENVNVK